MEEPLMAESWLHELRRAYPTIDLALFIEIVEGDRESDDLLDKLDEAEKKAKDEKDEADLKMHELGKELAMNEYHSRLHFVVPADVDLLHMQALIMYGFLRPGSPSPYIGRNVLPAIKIRENVANKLGLRFNGRKYDDAVQYAKRCGVVLAKRLSGEGEEALSLNSSEKETTTHGAQIVRVALEFRNRK